MNVLLQLISSTLIPRPSLLVTRVLILLSWLQEMWINREGYRTGEQGYLNALYTTLPLWLKVMKLGLLLTVSNDLQDKKSYTSHTKCYYHDNERTSSVLPWPLLSCCCLQYRLQVMKPEWGLASFQGHSSSYVSAIFLHWCEIKSGSWWPGNEAKDILPHVSYNSRLITRAHERPSYKADHWLVSKTTWRSLTHCWTSCQPCLLCIEFSSESDVLELSHGTDHTHTTQ